MITILKAYLDEIKYLNIERIHSEQKISKLEDENRLLKAQLEGIKENHDIDHATWTNIYVEQLKEIEQLKKEVSHGKEE